MREFKKRRSHKGEATALALRAGGVLLLLVVTGFAVRGAWGMYGKLAEASDGEQGAQAQLAALQAQTAQVQASVQDLSSERGVEAQVRERYGVVKPGEGVIEIVEDQASTTPASAPTTGFWARLWSTLFVW